MIAREHNNVLNPQFLRLGQHPRASGRGLSATAITPNSPFSSPIISADWPNL